MADANIRIPIEARDRLAAVAAGEGMSLRAYLSHLAETLLTSDERAQRAEQVQASLRGWSGYAPTDTAEAALDQELDRRLTEVQGP
ncbi:hypothetical protein ACIGHB_29785 [Streptomyces sp. NPDC085460]|uniref:hypothetical protein n=1 Tax=Streptomyces sp. NPDC085460 TaxID=3365723 RepID=UPI0037CFAAB1